MNEPERILEFWFGDLPMTAEALDRRMLFWFGGAGAEAQRQRDAEIRLRFGHVLERAAAGELAAWAAEPKGRLSLIILLDQFPRNVHRGTALAFAHDADALDLALEGIRIGADVELDPVESIFFYLPLQHAESLPIQDLAVAGCRRLLELAPPPLKRAFELTLRYAEEHRTIVARFGRFPHRNRVLGRESTAEENEYLATASSFGQGT